MARDEAYREAERRIEKARKERISTLNLSGMKGSVLRELHVLLKAQDPAHCFGGLERVQNKRREFLWIHAKYLKEY